MIRGGAHPIVVFDSGVGGFSILSAILALNLGYPIIYLADQDNFPYGDRSEEWLRTRLTQVVSWASTHSPTALVLACNTASVNAIDLVRDHLTCPVVGVEPVIKPLAGFSSPLLLATHASLDSARSQELTREYCPDLLTTCPTGLVQAIEDMDSNKIMSILTSLSELIETHEIDAIGLSCTHYPLAATELHSLYPSRALIDPAQAVAFHLSTLIPQAESTQTSVEYYTTGDPTKLITQVQYYLGHSVKASKVAI